MATIPALVVCQQQDYRLHRHRHQPRPSTVLRVRPIKFYCRQDQDFWQLLSDVSPTMQHCIGHHQVMRIQIFISLYDRFKLLLKKWAKPGLFCLFSFFLHDKYSTNSTINDKSVDGVLGALVRGGTLVGADQSTEL